MKPKMAISNLMLPYIPIPPQDHRTMSNYHREDPYPKQKQKQTITIYLEDHRQEEPDFQIAEVMLPVSPGPHGSGTCFVMSQDLVKELQSSSSRVDGIYLLLLSRYLRLTFAHQGSAKLFCFRKEPGTDKLWRQCILRVSEGGESVVGQGTAQVSPDLKVKVVIETASE
jgi:hypothetical protein